MRPAMVLSTVVGLERGLPASSAAELSHPLPIRCQQVGTLDGFAALMSSRRLQRCLGGMAFGLRRTESLRLLSRNCSSLQASQVRWISGLRFVWLAAQLAAAQHLLHRRISIMLDGTSGDFTRHATKRYEDQAV